MNSFFFTADRYVTSSLHLCHPLSELPFSDLFCIPLFLIFKWLKFFFNFCLLHSYMCLFTHIVSVSYVMLCSVFFSLYCFNIGKRTSSCPVPRPAPELLEIVVKQKEGNQNWRAKYIVATKVTHQDKVSYFFLFGCLFLCHKQKL